jgi:hypothetical protein
MLKAEPLIALALMGFSIYCMWHATVLPIGWIEGEGPGGGAFPFWLGLLMLLASAGILVRALLAAAPTEPFFDPDTVSQVAVVTAALVVTIALMQILGSYIAIPAFLIWYLRFFGDHSWRLTAVLVIGTMLTLFFFFEVALRILMPKGITEPLFVPLYQMFF